MEPTDEILKQPDQAIQTTALKAIEAQDYLKAAGDASARTRSVTIAMTVASVVIFGALINSLQHQWMLERLLALDNPRNEYVARKIGPYPQRTGETDEAFRAAEGYYYERYKLFYEAVAKAYVENSLSTKVPLFGFSVDANDIGLIGGAAFVVLLLMYRYSLAREVENLRIAREQAGYFKQYKEFYLVLAMQQVFTIPPSETRARTKLNLWIPRLISALPFAVLLAVTVHDIITTGSIGNLLSKTHNLILILVEFVSLGSLLVLTGKAIERHREVDKIWEDWWDDLRKRGLVGLPRPAVLERTA
jgi:hypothetical protein